MNPIDPPILSALRFSESATQFFAAEAFGRFLGRNDLRGLELGRADLSCLVRNMVKHGIIVEYNGVSWSIWVDGGLKYRGFQDSMRFNTRMVSFG